MKFNKFLLSAIAICLTFTACIAQAVKSPTFNLFKPVPKTQMRDMETDRPDVTESPLTVDAGHFQYEADLVRFERQRDELSSQKTLLINQANLKLGITGSSDLRIVLQSYGRQHEKDLITAEKSSTSGFGNLIIRFKQNLTGNNGGNFAIAILPFIKFPTSKFDPEGRYEGGIIVPMQLQLPWEWKLGLQLEGDRMKDQQGNALHTQLLQALTLSHEIVKGMDGIVETYYTFDFKQHH